jgi:preprotein translocase subunit YajC
MKLVSNLLENIEGIQVFYIIGLLIFLALFIIIFIRTMRRPAREMKEIKESILMDNDSEGSITS